MESYVVAEAAMSLDLGVALGHRADNAILADNRSGCCVRCRNGDCGEAVRL